MLFLYRRDLQLTAVGFDLLLLCLPVRPVRLVIHAAVPKTSAPKASTLSKHRVYVNLGGGSIFSELHTAFGLSNHWQVPF